MQLICDVLVHDSKSSACLNDEQRSMLTSFSHKGASVPQHRGKRYLNDRHGLYIVLFAGVSSLSQCCFLSCVFIPGYQWLMSPPSSRTQTLVMTERMMIWWSIIFSIIFIHAVGLLSDPRKVHVHKNHWKDQKDSFWKWFCWYDF